jgi:hypothetical protein
MAVDISGAWTIRLTFILGSTTHSAVLTVQGTELAGAYHGKVGTAPIRGAISDSSIQFSTTLRYEATNLPYLFTGTVQGDTMSGEVTMGEYWTAQWTATRRDV